MKLIVQKIACRLILVLICSAAWATGTTCVPPFNTSVFGTFSGVLNDIGMGQDGTVWSIGSSGVGLVLRGTAWTGGSVLGLPGGQASSIGRIAGGPDGSPWAVDNNNHIWHFANGAWQGLPGLARDIAVTSNGTAWVVGTQSTTGGFHIYFWNGSQWIQDSGSGIRIAGGSGLDTQPWVVNSSNQIYHRNSDGSFTQLPGLGNDIGVDLTDTPWVLGTNSASGGFEVYHFVSGSWLGDPNVGGISLTGGDNGFGSGCGAFIIQSSAPNNLAASVN